MENCCDGMTKALDEGYLQVNVLNKEQVFLWAKKRPLLAINNCPFCGTKNPDSEKRAAEWIRRRTQELNEPR